MFDLNSIPDEKNTFYLEDGQFLDTVKNSVHDFKEGLPSGILNKKYTGIGATTVEFQSARKSIIVFPFRKIALEKYKKWKDSKKVLYVGTDEKNKSKSIDDVAYFLKENSKENFKMCVVADSIDKVVGGFKKAGLDPYSKDLFLVLDEVEILQLQSGFRNKLPLCFEYFKKFKRKCLVSATLLDFSDAEIRQLPVYHIERVIYDKELGHEEIVEKVDFKQYKSNYPHLAVAQDILSFYKRDLKYHRYKFFIGLNSKEAINLFIKEIKKENDQITISVIASEQSKDDFLENFTKLDIKDGLLPCQINLCTSVAWSGIDIVEPFFSVAISLNTEIHHSFSFENLIQFFGRCRIDRDKQLSKTFVVGDKTSLSYKRPDGDYIERVNDIKSMIDFINEKITSKADKNRIFKALLEGSSNLIYSDIKNKPKANWLLKDLESYTQNVVEDYSNIKRGLLNKLAVRYQIEEKETIFREIEVEEKSSDEKLEARLEILLANFSKDYSNTRLINHIRKQKMPTLRLAAYWYLFGRKVLENEEEGLKLAEYYSGFSGELPSNALLSITKLALDGIYLYQFEPKIWESLIDQMSNLCNGNRGRKAADFEVIFRKPEFYPFFPSVINSKHPTASVGSFIKYFIGVNAASTRGGSQTFVINAKENQKPKLYNDYSRLKGRLDSVNKFPKIGAGISFDKASIQNILLENFSLNT